MNKINKLAKVILSEIQDDLDVKVVENITNILLPTFKKDFGFGDVSSVRIAEVRKDKVELYINLKD